MPGVINCFSCALDTNGSIAWQVMVNGDLAPLSSSPDAVAVITEYRPLRNVDQLYSTSCSYFRPDQYTEIISMNGNLRIVASSHL